MAFAFTVQPPVRAAAHSQLLDPPRPRLDAVSAVMQSAKAAFAFAGFTTRPPMEGQPQQHLPESREAPGAASQPEMGWPTELRASLKLGRVIGHGAFGTLRLATHRVTGESLAIKVRRPCLLSRQARLHACLHACRDPVQRCSPSSSQHAAALV